MLSSVLGAWAELEILPQIHASYCFILGKFLCRAFFQDFSFKQQVCPVCDVQGFLNVVVSDEHPNSPLSELMNDALDVLYSNGVDPRKRLVKQG